MDPAIALKLLTDFSIYLAFAGLILPSMAAAVPALCIAACAALSSCFENKRMSVRVLCFLPAAVVLALSIRSVGFAVCTLPLLLYAMVSALTGRVAIDRDEFLMYFRPVTAILIVSVLLGLFFEREGTTVDENALPMAAAALLLGTILLRTLRHTVSTRCEKRFIVANLLAPVAVIAVAFALAKMGLLSLIGDGLSLFYEKVIFPILIGLAYAIYGVIWGIEQVFRLLFRSKTQEGNEPAPMELGELGGELLPEGGENGSLLVEQILIAIGILLAITAAFFLFKRMLGRRGERAGAGGNETREHVDQTGGPRSVFSMFAPKTANEQVRKVFIKFMKKMREQGAVLTPFDTSESICARAKEVFSDAEAITELRAIYIAARYGANETGKDDVRRAKALFERIKKSAPAVGDAKEE